MISFKHLLCKIGVHGFKLVSRLELSHPYFEKVVIQKCSKCGRYRPVLVDSRYSSGIFNETGPVSDEWLAAREWAVEKCENPWLTGAPESD